VTLLGHIRAVPAETHCLLLIGHNPGLEELVRSLAGSSSSACDRASPRQAWRIFEDFQVRGQI